MKTVIIYDSMKPHPMGFAIVKGDYRHLDRVYINISGDEVLMDELEALVESDEFQNSFTMAFPYEEVKNGAYVIVCGWLT